MCQGLRAFLEAAVCDKGGGGGSFRLLLPRPPEAMALTITMSPSRVGVEKAYVITLGSW